MYSFGLFVFVWTELGSELGKKSTTLLGAQCLFCSCSLACLDKFMAMSFYSHYISLYMVNACLISDVCFSYSGFAQVWQVTEIPPQH